MRKLRSYLTVFFSQEHEARHNVGMVIICQSTDWFID